ncbi:MAG: cupin domain-containing protein [Lachnospiraceae bacterium]|nr:cupin domain-containing protein [Lachnospiraceae bacterium]
MISLAKDREKYFRSNIRGGNGSLQFEDLIPKDQLPNTVRTLSLSVIKKGESIGLHEHIEEGEFYFVISGEATVVCDEQEFTMTRFDSTWTEQKGNFHSIRNDKDEDVIVLFLVLRLPDDVRQPEWKAKCLC